ncbi:DUF4837 family protein [uncultured Parabacteroides sp.]|uniref:DUF4837 family protein n=1 Tax=uncultured Parabacteroides sp. TaxID=512312 RepID=UPI0025D7B911|nr:DUF4837 family protein [uncultured Parabacteroides sp.]
MRTQSLIIVILLVLIGGTACNRSSKPKQSIFMKRATGFAYEVLVVMDKDTWKGEAGRLLYGQLTASIPGLPQNEPTMRVTYAEPSQFDGLLRYVRNIMVVRVNSSQYTKVSVNKEKDLWATGQEVVTLNAPSSQQLMEYLTEHGTSLVAYLEGKERERAAGYLESAHSAWVNEKVKDRFNASLYVPEEMCSYKDTTDFFWVTDHGRQGRTDLIVYSFPYISDRTFTLDYLVSMRDSILGEQIPGAFPNSYMTTVKRLPPSYEAINRNGEYCGVVRGLWELEGDMMGGPFVSHAYLDKKNQRVVVAETFVYAPNTKKAKLLRRGEAALYTFKFN